MNAWTVGLAGGLLEGAPIRLAAEIARVVDDGPNMHVLPIVTRGATENLNSLLYLRGVDTAIINSDALEEYKIQVPEIGRRIVYLLNLFPSELHIFVRPEIQNLQDLVGKKVNFNTLGTAAAYSGPLIFSRLGLNVEKTFIPHQVALEQMRKGELAAVVFITSKPVDAFVRGRWEPGFKFLPVNYESKFEDYYLPAVLEASEYPNLIKQGERVSTIAVPTVLVAFNWPAGSNRYQRVARFVDYLFSRIDRLQAPGFDPKWKAINLGATVPGLDPLLGGAAMAGSSVAPSASIAMKSPAIPLSVALGSQARWPSHKTNDPVSQLRACSVMERAERLKCLDNLSRNIAPGSWPRAGPQLDCQRNDLAGGLYADRCCQHVFPRPGQLFNAAVYFLPQRSHRNGGHRISAFAQGEDYAVTYSINGNQPVRVAAGSPSFGTGVAFQGDVVRLLQSFPDEGEIAIHLSTRTAAAVDRSFSLGGLKDGAGKNCRGVQMAADAVASPRH